MHFSSFKIALIDCPANKGCFALAFLLPIFPLAFVHIIVFEAELSCSIFTIAYQTTRFGSSITGVLGRSQQTEENKG
jgi:hypothetical protein